MSYTDIMAVEHRIAFEERQLSPITATPTHLPMWNQCCGDDGGGIGIADGWFIVLGGNPKYGKSLLAIELAKHAMISGKKPGFVSLEMSKYALSSRVYAMLTDTPVWKLEKRGFTEDQFLKTWKAMDPTGNGYSFVVDDTPHTGIDQIIATLEQMIADGCNFLIVDYLQLASMGSEESIHKAVGHAANAMRLIAKREGVAMVALSQFNRETSKNYVDTPQPQGLHGGMVIEASADQIMLIDHSRFDREGSISRTYLELTNRHGAHGSIPVEWNYRTLRTREAEPDEEMRWPTNARTKAR